MIADSQCGFRCNCSYTDLIFCAFHLLEKTIEHDTKAFILFVDLRRHMIQSLGL